MRRISLILTGAVLCALIAFSGSAAAKGTTKTCTTSSNKVVGKTVKGHVYSRYVTKSQKEYATCGYAKKVMNRVIKLGLEEPKSVMGFRCTPTVAANNQNHVKYKCVFKGADSAMYVKIGFALTFKS
jgi:hypothetical protein